MTINKIKTLEEIKSICKDLGKNKKLVLCHGAFDLMHTGHIRHLNSAKKNGDILIVSLTADKYIVKGPGRPVFNEILRAENIAALECVDYVFISDSFTAIKSIDTVKPHLYAKGSDYKVFDNDLTNNIKKEVDRVRSYGGDIFFTDEIVFSSSSLLNKYFSTYSDDVKNFLENFTKKYTKEEVFFELNKLKNLKVLVVGDIIFDHYCFIDSLGQTGKGGIMSVAFQNDEIFAGGSLAISNHVSNFVNNLILVAPVSKAKEDSEFIKSSLGKNVKLKLFKILSKTTKKTRYLDSDMHRFFEVYYFDGNVDLKDDHSYSIVSYISKIIHNYDLVIASDFGNGSMSKSIRNLLSDSSKFLAVNTQINSANRGYHSINKYKKANFISLNEPEARLSIHNKTDPIEMIANTIKSKITKSQFIAITKGSKGIYFSSNKNCFNQPALTSSVVDRVGAGDAFLSLTSMLLANKCNPEIACFIGSAAAALDTQIVCNKESISKIKLQKFLTTLYK